MPLTRIPPTLSCHSSLWCITSLRSSMIHFISVQSFWIQVLVGQPTLAVPCQGVYKYTLLMGSSLLLQQCPMCLDHLIMMVFEMAGRWPYSCRFVRGCLKDLFKTDRTILVKLPSSFSSYAKSESKWCIHMIVLIRLLLVKTAFLFIG